MIKHRVFILLIFFSMIILSFSFTSYADEFEDPFTYYSNNDGTHVIYTSFYFPVEDSAVYFNMYIPFTQYSNIMEDEGNEFKSLILIYNDDYSLTDQIDLSTYVGGMEVDDGYWFWDDSTTDGENLLNGAYFRIELIQTYDNHADPSYLEFFNDKFMYAFDEELDLGGDYQFTYYIGDEIWYKGYYEVGGTPPLPVTPKIDNLYFVGWFLYNGVKYDFDPIPFDEYGADPLILSAKFQFNAPTGNNDLNDVTPSIIEDLLTVIGFNNTVGKMIIYVAILISSVVGMLAIKLNAFTIILVEVVIFGVFIFLGWIPLYMIIIMGLIFLTGLIHSIRKGVD